MTTRNQSIVSMKIEQTIISEDNLLLVAEFTYRERELRKELKETCSKEVFKTYRPILKSFKSTERRCEWMASRIVCAGVEPNLPVVYDETGKPKMLGSNLELSISHTEGMIAILFSTKGLPGVDIQLFSENIERVAHKFANDHELENKYKRVETLNTIWSAKEALYKIWGKQVYNFKRTLAIKKFRYEKNGKINAEILLNDINHSIKLNYFTHKQAVVVWAVH
ncbi:MAG TPA: hypothetical protein DCQ31_05185 [Bacteroidales bacterium]|nr:hypothetical protein [Bacteroidales bacterium]